jgi:phytoene synthase
LAASADTPPSVQDAFAHCGALVRTADKDRFLSGLFAPADLRPALHALYAFNVEISRVGQRVREPLAGEIRLQWWEDAIAGHGAGDVGSNPVAAALLATVARHGLPIDLLSASIAAHRFDLYNEAMATRADFEAYGRATSSALIVLAAKIFCEQTTPGLEDFAFHAGLASGIANLLQAFPLHAARGQLFLPFDILSRHEVRREDIAGGRTTTELRAALSELRLDARAHLEQAGQLAADIPGALLPAWLPLALVRPILDGMERPQYDPFHPVEFAPWRRQWRLWRAARRPERIFA